MKKVLIVDDIDAWQNFNTTRVLENIPDANIITASSAKEAYNRIIENSNNPFDIIITDMQMESDFEPKYAGEWLIEQIKALKSHLKSKIIIISGAYNVRTIAKLLNVECIPKTTAMNFPQAFEELLKNT